MWIRYLNPNSNLSLLKQVESGYDLQTRLLLLCLRANDKMRRRGNSLAVNEGRGTPAKRGEEVAGDGAVGARRRTWRGSNAKEIGSNNGDGFVGLAEQRTERLRGN